MTFFEFLEKVRNKPKYVRVQILVVCVAVSMVGIVSLWIGSFKANLSSSIEESQKTSISADLMAPFKQVREEIPSLKEAFANLLGAFSSEENSPAGLQIEENGEEDELGEIETKNEEVKPAKLPLSR